MKARLALAFFLQAMLSVCRALKHGRMENRVLKVPRNTVTKIHFSSRNDGEVVPSRFWSREIACDVHLGGKDSKAAALENVISLLKENGETKNVAIGMAIADLPTLGEGYIIPIHDGLVQSQHVLPMGRSNKGEGEEGKILLCAFNPRAQPNQVSPSEQERAVDPERLLALNKELEAMDISAEDLMGDDLAGTSPAKIYRSFVCPRPGKAHLIEPVERAAKRTASQLELSLRQVRADQSAYLRNVDKSKDVLSMTSGDRYEDSGSGNTIASTRHPMVILLDNVRSAFNVGSLFRTGETAGIEEIITAGITAHPPHPKLRKTAMQSLEAVPTRHYSDVMDAVRALKDEGYTICVMETTSKSEIYTETDYPEKTCLVLGNEITGVDTRIIDIADKVVEIPTYGVKNSLNVASAGPIVMFEVLRKWHLKDAK